MILLPETQTRINDRWITDGSIPCEPPDRDIQHPLIGNTSRQTRTQADFYSRIAFDIVSETVYNYPYPYVSEKSLRPLTCKRLFVIQGAPGVLNLLYQKGFDIFPDFINIEYDSITCPVRRFHVLVQEIQRLIDTPLHVFKTFYKDNAERFESNAQRIRTLRQRECDELKSRLSQNNCE